MIVFGASWAYSVHGSKVDELLKWIKLRFEFTHLKEGEDLSAVKKMLEDKIDELNRKYPKTVKYYLHVDPDRLRIGPDGYVMRCISIKMLSVKPFRELAKT